MPPKPFRFGVNIFEPYVDAFAPVVARLAG